MAGCKSGGLIQKEQFCPQPRRHHLAVPAFKLQQAGNPGFKLKGAQYGFGITMQLTSVTYPGTPCTGFDNIALRVYPILQHVK
jgi:hypothetical protein